MSSVGRASSYPLSPMQQGLLFHSLYERSAGLYIQQLVCAIREELNVTAFVRAWQHLFTHQSTLRTSFCWDGVQGPVQEVDSGLTLPFAHEDWRNVERAEQETRLASYLLADRERGFGFDEAPLMRCALLRLADDDYRFVWTSHHALFDGRSRLLLLRQLSALYEDCSRDLESLPFRDYIDWLETQDLSAAEQFWREKLRGFDSPTPLIAPASAIEGEHKEQAIRFTSDETATLQTFAQQYGLTMNSLLQGAWALLLARCSGEEDILFGTTRSCRRSLPFDAESMIGLVVNTVPLRVAAYGGSVLLDWLKELRAKHIALREYEHTPLVKIQEWSEVPKGSPLFESLVVFENYQLGDVLRTESTLWRNAEFQLIEQANYPLSLVGYGGRELLLKLSYDRERFNEATIARLLDYLRAVLLAFVGNPSQKLRDIVLLTPAEQRQLLVEWNRTSVDYPEQLCVHQLFERRRERDRRDFTIAQQFDQRRSQRVFSSQVQRRTARECGKDLRRGRVKAQRRELKYVTSGFEIESANLRFAQVSQTAMFDHHAFGASGRAGGVNDVSDVGWRDFSRRRFGAFSRERPIEIYHPSRKTREESLQMSLRDDKIRAR